nr:helix-turn-helix domain-containing protein [uncultured Bacteroides sp.]
MSIQEIIQSGANISITVGTNDLLQFADHLISSTKKELEASISAKKKENYVTPDNAGKQLHVDRSTLWRWSKTRYLVPIEVGGKRLYKQSEIDAILNK